MANRKYYAIYVPGLGDNLYYVQTLLIQLWRLWGVRPIMFTMLWSGEEKYDSKMAHLISAIDTLKQQGHLVILVGASAGASAVLNAYVQRKDEIVGIAYICGKINHPDTVSSQTFMRNPTFKTALLHLQHTLSLLNVADKRKLSSFFSPADKTVPYADTVIEGVLEYKLPSLSHAWAIIYALSVGSRRIIQTIKK